MTLRLRLCLGILWVALLAQAPLAVAQTLLAAIPPLDSPVVDTTGTLDAAQRQQLVQQLLDLRQRKGSQLQVLIVSSAEPEDIEQYTQRVFDEWQLGRQGVDDGVLLVVAKDDRSVRIQPGYGLEGAIPDVLAGRIIREYLVPRFQANDYWGGIEGAVGALTALVDGETLPPPEAATRQDLGLDGALSVAFFATLFTSVLLGRVARKVRCVACATVAALLIWVLSASLLYTLAAALLGAFIGLVGVNGGGGAARGGGWGSGSGGFGRGGSGGWSGGGGRSGGGGASGRW